MEIVRAGRDRIGEWVALRRALWPGAARRALEREAEHMIGSRREAAFLAIADTGIAAGFAEVSVRQYAEGAAPGPAGYLEGIYVRPAFRKKGISGRLVRAAEAWARSRGCREMGSDAYIDDTRSIAFHRAMGFRIVERQVVFLKTLPRPRCSRASGDGRGQGGKWRRRRSGNSLP